MLSCFQSINVIENREFRDLLLLLREDLKDSDIPHRTKVRQAIVEAWVIYINALKAELAVREPVILYLIVMLTILRLLWVLSTLQRISGPAMLCGRILPSRAIGSQKSRGF
jgi:hypothetical protein